MSAHISKNIGIGELHVAKAPTIISTILGSCVSVCLFDPETGLGGLIHYALPTKKHAEGTQRSDLNFGDLAIHLLVDKFLAAGVDPKQLQAKIVGGASTVKGITQNIGELNVQCARRVLKELGIPVVGEKVGGSTGMKLFFYSDSGRLRVSGIDAEVEAPTPKKGKKRVLIVDDSKVIREVLKRILTCESIDVVGSAGSAEEAFPLIKSLKPDVITLDIHMPGMDGVEFLQKYLPLHPIPTVMISSINIHESDQVIKALEYGAVDYIAKPSFEDISAQTELIREKIVTASSIAVRKHGVRSAPVKKALPSRVSQKVHSKILAIGASTGGTEAIKDVLLGLPADIPPTVIVQHIPPVFSTAFSKRLNDLCPFEVKEAVDGDQLLPGRVLIAPGGMQMELKRVGEKYFVHVYAGERVNRHMPSVDVLFNSVAKLVGNKALGVILTGMGDDGARGLLNMHKQGALTITQDEASSVVYGMPKAAFEMGASDLTCSLQSMADAIMKNLEKNRVA